MCKYSLIKLFILTHDDTPAVDRNLKLLMCVKEFMCKDSLIKLMILTHDANVSTEGPMCRQAQHWGWGVTPPPLSYSTEQNKNLLTISIALYCTW